MSSESVGGEATHAVIIEAVIVMDAEIDPDRSY